jgi:fibronectin type 3 domain-containing protein
VEVAAAANSGTQITVSWNAVESAASYHIYRSDSVSGEYALVGNSATVSYKEMLAGKAYFYKVSAVNVVGEGS